MVGGWRPRARQRVTHTALFYSDAQEYLDGVRIFIAEAAETGAPAVIAVPAVGLERLREGLDGALDHVQLTDMAELGANPARIIPAISTAIDAHAGQTLYFVAEPVWAERSRDEIGEAMRHEALINQAFASTRLRILCPYDAAAIDAPILADAERTHRWVSAGNDRRASSAYRSGALPACCDTPLSSPPAEATSLQFGLADLAQVRALVSEHAASAGLAVPQCGEIVLAVDEIATNSIRHGGGVGTLHSWHEHGRLTCQISDAGELRDPLAGRVRPDPEARGGRGLWLVNQLCDLVQIRSGPSGTTVRVHARRREHDGRAEHELTSGHSSSAGASA
jgi:anti-sigma regulatory factor (Ser/Thr protein kinase)